jgi:23S rRNA pseudouridine2605 synthase
MSRPSKSRRQKLRRTADWNSHKRAMTPTGDGGDDKALSPRKRQAIKRRKSGNDTPVRLNKLIADSGLCSRREADNWIADGRVSVNFETITQPGVKAMETDVVLVDGRPLPRQFKQTVLFHKPAGVVTTRKDDKGRETIYDVLPKRYHNCDPAGRLDRQSSGLLLLSNDGDFLHELTHPKTQLEKVYRVRVDKLLTTAVSKRLVEGVEITLDDDSAPARRVTATAARVEILSEFTLTITLLTGLNRQVRRMLAALGYHVTSLRRVSVGPVVMGRLPVGKCRLMTKDEHDAMRKHIRRQAKLDLLEAKKANSTNSTKGSGAKKSVHRNRPAGKTVSRAGVKPSRHK